MRFKNYFILLFFIPSVWAELDITSQTFQADLNRILNLKTCRLRGNDSSRDVDLIEELKLQTSLNTGMIEDVVIYITQRTSSNSLNCYLRVNLTVLLAQSMDRLGYYFEAVDLYEKLLTYKGLENNFKKNINRLISQAKTKQISKQRKSKQPLTDMRIELTNQDKRVERAEKPNNETISKLAGQIIALENEITNLKSEAASSNAEMNALEISSNKVLDDFAKQESYIEELERDLLDYELYDPNANKDKIFQNLSDQLVFFEDQNSFLSSSNKELQESNESLQKEIFGLKKQIEGIERQFDKISANNNSLQNSKQGVPLFYIVIAFLIGALLSKFYKNDSLSNRKIVWKETTQDDESRDISGVSGFKKLEMALDSLLLTKDFGFDENGNFLFGYIKGLVDDFYDDLITASLEKDKLLERYFDLALVEIEKYFRFSSSPKIYEVGLKAGKQDAQSFRVSESLSQLESHLLKQKDERA